MGSGILVVANIERRQNWLRNNVLHVANIQWPQIRFRRSTLVLEAIKLAVGQWAAELTRLSPKLSNYPLDTGQRSFSGFSQHKLASKLLRNEILDVASIEWLQIRVCREHF